MFLLLSKLAHLWPTENQSKVLEKLLSNQNPKGLNTVLTARMPPFPYTINEFLCTRYIKIAYLCRYTFRYPIG